MDYEIVDAATYQVLATFHADGTDEGTAEALRNARHAYAEIVKTTPTAQLIQRRAVEILRWQ